MKIHLRTILIVLLLFAVNNLDAQKFKFDATVESQTINFKLINNLIVLPIEINGREFSFILDSGVSTPVIFNRHSKYSDSLFYNNLRKVKLRGLGEGEPVEALYSKENKMQLGDISNLDQDLFIIYSDKLDLFAKLGVNINGVIGYSLFNNFVITIDYIAEKLTFSNPESYVYKKCRKCETFDLLLYKKKPLIQAEIAIEDPILKKIPVQLLIDSGGTDSLWLFEDEEKGITVPANSFEDFIGEGISGGIYGMRSRIKSFTLKSFVIKNPNVAYLDSISTAYARGLKTRNGSLGGNILRRFKVIMDYPNKKITLKKNSAFNDSFNYNMSGIELIHAGKALMLIKELARTSFKVSAEDHEAYPDDVIVFDYDYGYRLKSTYKIAYVRKGSPAEYAGLLEGDQLVKINGKFAYNYKLSEIVEKFYVKDGKLVKMSVERNGKILDFKFNLKKVL